MKKLLEFTFVVLVALVFAAGCATTVGQGIEAKIAADVGPDAIKALQDLKALPIIAKVRQDAAATQYWADKFLGPNGAKPNPDKYFQASLCPTAANRVGDRINATIDGLIAQIQAMQAPPDPNAPQGFAMLFLTQQKYGDSPDAKAKLQALKDELALQRDILFAGCAHLFPKKQVDEVLKLMGKAGITGLSGGALGQLMGLGL